MRFFACCLVVLLLPTVPAVPVVVLADAPDDVRIDPLGPTQPDRWDQMDLLRLDMDEDIRSFVFHLWFTPPEDPSQTITDAAEYTIQFRYGTILYMIHVNEYRLVPDEEPDYAASLYIHDSPGDYGTLQARLAVDGAPGVGRVTVHVPHAYVLDQNGVEAFRGSMLTDVVAHAGQYWRILADSTATPSDRMPDAGNGQWPVRFGAEQTGHVRLATSERIRGSNGEATTYLWRINITNLDPDFEDRMVLTLSDVPEEWGVRLPLESVKVPANSSIEFPVLLTTPFQHQHGVTERFLLEARSIRDSDAVGRLELGVEYLTIPQPAGHHDTVWLHDAPARASLSLAGGGALVQVGTGTSTTGYMNAQPQDMGSAGDPLFGHTQGRSDARTLRSGWILPLSPQLRLGLDFDLQRTGTLDLDVHTPLAWTDAFLEGKLILLDHQDYSPYPDDYDELAGVDVLADVTPTTPQNMGQGSDTRLSTMVVARPGADLVRHDPDHALALLLWLHGDGVPTVRVEDGPAILPGAKMRLPLEEYHDPIDASFAAPNYFTVLLNESTERFLAPGTSLLYELHVRNQGADNIALLVSADGRNADWIGFPRGLAFQVPGNGSVVIPVSLTAPESVDPGEKADVILEVYGRDDPRTRGLTRIVATIVGEGGEGDAGAILAEADQSLAIQAIEDGQKESPAPSILILLGLAACALYARHIRRS